MILNQHEILHQTHQQKKRMGGGGGGGVRKCNSAKCKCKCKCRLDVIVCNNKQRWNKMLM